MGRKFDGGSDDVMKRLHGTICIYNGRPVYVRAHIDPKTGGYSDKLVVISEMQNYDRYGRRDAKPTVIDYTADTFSYKAFPLGYINHMGNAYYTSRVPYRYQYYGLNPDCIAWDPHPGDTYATMFSTSFSDMIARNYPPMDDAEARVIAGERAIAVTPDIAFARVKGKVMNLLFKGKVIGIKMNTPDWQLFDMPEKQFLTKILSRSGVKI